MAEQDFTTVQDGIDNLTRFQKSIYDHIIERTERDGVPPTMREIARGLGISSTNAYHHVHMLTNVGLLVRETNRRGYRIAGMSAVFDKGAPLYVTETKGDSENE